MKVIFIILVTLAIAAVWWVTRRGTAVPVPAAIDKSKTVIAFGDSLVQGQGAPEDKNFVSVLSQRLDMPIVNAGRGGDTTAMGLARLDADVLAKRPDVVIVLLGGNDALRQISETETFSNLNAIISQIQNSGAKVLLLGIRGGVFGDTYKNKFEQLAKDRNVPYISDVLSGLFSDSRYMSDAIHPNALGYAKIADRVEPELRKLLQ